MPNLSIESSPDSARELDRIESEITELAAYIHAATFRLLELIGEFDEREGWFGSGLRSCALWLNWKCGIGLGAAREKVRVAHALKNLPEISDQFRRGGISFSKVRAMTRVASPENEEYLLMIARHGTASHVELLVRQFRKVKRIEAMEAEIQRHDLRELNWQVDDDGSYVFRARLTPEQGERVVKALESAMDDEFEERKNVSAETSDRPGIDPASDPVAQRRADALTRVAEGFLGGNAGTNGGERTTIQLHTDSDTLRHDGDGGETRMDNLVLLCRHHHRLVHEGGYGVRMTGNSIPEFTDPSDQILPAAPQTHFRGNVIALRRQNGKAGLDITPETPVPLWEGEKMDSSMAIEALLWLESPKFARIDNP